jgi:hypothetical protein
LRHLVRALLSVSAMRFPLATGVLLAPLLFGCGDWLARHNPCGGIYPAQGVAEVTTERASGTVSVVTAGGDLTDAIVPESEATGSGSCEAFFSGLASDDDSATSTLQVTCHDGAAPTLLFTVPDVRPLEEGAVVTLQAQLSDDNSQGHTCTSTSSATPRIDRAVGGQAPSPTFVTSDFVREASITFDSATPGACAARVTITASLTVEATDYSQAMQEGAGRCPPLPSK